MNALPWSASAVIALLIAADYLRDLKRQRREDRACAEFMRELEQSW